MLLSELPAYLEMLAVRAGEAAIPASDAMGDGFEKEVKRVLRERVHARPTRTPSAAGEPPAMESGALADSVAMVPASTPVVATSSVSPHLPPRDWVQEYGLPVIRARGSGFMHFYYPEERFEKAVHIPARPYIRPTVARMVANGELTTKAAEAFYAAMWG